MHVMLGYRADVDPGPSGPRGMVRLESPRMVLRAECLGTPFHKLDFGFETVFGCGMV